MTIKNVWVKIVNIQIWIKSLFELLNMADISEGKRAEILAQISRLASFNESFGDVFNLTEQG